MNIIKITAAASAIAMTITASGCALVRFEDGESQKESQEKLQTVDTPETVEPRLLLDEEKLVIDEGLTDGSGAETARYHAEFPYFTNDNDSPILSKINDFYQDEYEQMLGDKDRFFKIVAEKPTEGLRTTEFRYRLLDCPEEYISVLRSYEGVDSLGAEQKTYYCEVFSAVTGWKLRFSDIFGEDAEEAKTALNVLLESWSKEREYTTSWIYNAGDDKLLGNIAFDNDTLYVALPAYTAPGGETLIELPIDGFVELLGE